MSIYLFDIYLLICVLVLNAMIQIKCGLQTDFAHIKKAEIIYFLMFYELNIYYILNQTKHNRGPREL